MKTAEILIKYIRSHLGAVVSFLIFIAVLCFTFYLYDFPLSSILYAFLVSLVPILLIFTVDFVRYRRRMREIQNTRADVINGLHKLEIKSGYIEQELCGIIDEMGEKHREEKLDKIMQQREAEEYYAMWVHQIKTPISAMKLMLMQENNPAYIKQRQELFKIEKYVEMVLGFLRINSVNTDFVFESVRLHDIAKQAAKEFAASFIYNKISLELEDFENVILTDKKWLSFVIEQVLSNALKYTEHGAIKIYADSDDVLYIEDSGCGISAEDLPRIFDKGYTGFNGRVEHTSTGIGLYLCKRIMDKLECGIEVLSTEGKGTTVKLLLHKNALFTIG